VTEQEEEIGLDLSQHDEQYHSGEELHVPPPVFEYV
jgi:hypothetical protein